MQNDTRFSVSPDDLPHTDADIANFRIEIEGEFAAFAADAGFFKAA